MNWLEIKDYAASLILEKDALHIYAAVAIQVGVARLTGRSLGHWLPWLCVLALEAANEILDIVLGQEVSLKAWQVDGALHDALNTMLMPSLLLLLCRRAPHLVAWRRPVAAAPSAEPGATPGT